MVSRGGEEKKKRRTYTTDITLDGRSHGDGGSSEKNRELHGEDVR